MHCCSVSDLGQIPSVGDITGATVYLQGKLNDFRALEPRLADMQHDAALLAAAARERDPSKVDEAMRLVESIGTLRVEHGETLDRLNSLIESVPGLGLPIIPLALAATAIAIAASMAFIFRKVSSEEAALALIEKGLLTPDEARQLRAGIGGVAANFSRIAQYGAIAIGLYFGLPIIARLIR